MTVIGPIPLKKWLTLKRLSQSIHDEKTKPERLEKETFLFKFIKDKFKEAA